MPGRRKSNIGYLTRKCRYVRAIRARRKEKEEKEARLRRSFYSGCPEFQETSSPYVATLELRRRFLALVGMTGGDRRTSTEPQQVDVKEECTLDEGTWKQDIKEESLIEDEFWSPETECEPFAFVEIAVKEESIEDEGDEEILERI